MAPKKRTHFGNNVQIRRSKRIKSLLSQKDGDPITSNNISENEEDMATDSMDSAWTDVEHLLNGIHSGDADKVVQIVESWNATNLRDNLSQEDYLYYAILSNNIFIVQLLVLHGASIFSDRQDKNLLLTAIEKGNVDIVDFLAVCFENAIDYADKDGNSALIMCQSLPSANAITKILLNHHADVHHQNKEGETALMKAVQNKNLNTVIQLIKHGADIDTTDNNGNTASSLGKDYNWQQILDTLHCNYISKCIDVSIGHAVSEENLGLLKMLLITGLLDVQAVDEEEHKGAGLNRIFDSKFGEEHTAGTNPFTETEMKMICVLLNSGADLTQDKFKGHESVATPLYKACKFGDVPLVEFLIKHGPINIHGTHVYRNILEMIIRLEKFEIFDAFSPLIQRMITEGHSYPWQFEKPLHSAIRQGSLTGVSNLIKLLKLSSVDNFDFNDLWYIAANSEHYSIYSQLKGVRPDIYEKMICDPTKVTNLLVEACKCDSYEIVEDILEGIIVRANTTDLDVSPDHHPFQFVKSARMAELLFKYGNEIPDLHSKIVETNVGSRTLVEAVKLGSQELVDFLFDRGVQISQQTLKDIHMQCLQRKDLISSVCSKIPDNIHSGDPNYMSQVLCDRETIRRGDLDFLQWLVARGADINYSNGLALYEASMYGQVSVVQFLVNRRANLNCSSVRESPLFASITSCAAEKRLLVCKTLLEAGADANTICRSKSLLETALLLDDKFKRDPHLIALIIKHGGDILSRAAVATVHRCIAMREFYLLSVLIHQGGFSPTLVDERNDHYHHISESFCRVRARILKSFRRILTPLCMAFLCGEAKLARDMVHSLYITSSDIQGLPRNGYLRNHLIEYNFYECLTYLDELAGTAPSLMQLSFAKVSDLIGSAPGRQTRVKRLGLPNSLKNYLTFQSEEQELKSVCDSVYRVGDDERYNAIDHVDIGYDLLSTV